MVENAKKIEKFKWDILADFQTIKSQVDLSGFVDWKGGGWLSVLSVAESCALIFISDSLLCFSVEELDSVLCLFVIAMLVAYLTSSTSRKRQMRHSGQHRQWMDIVANKNSSEISLTELGLILMMVALFQFLLINLTRNQKWRKSTFQAWLKITQIV